MVARWDIRKYTSQEIVGNDLEEAIIAFDRVNMAPLLATWGIDFPEEKRRRGLSAGHSVHIASNLKGDILGYIEYGPDWSDSQDVYISSVQVLAEFRGTSLLGHLLGAAARDLASQPFRHVKSNVQKENRGAIALYRRLGFKVDEEHPNATSFPVLADRTILESPLIKKLIEKYACPTATPHQS